MLVVVHGSGFGWYPTWYLIFESQYSFFVSSTHFVIASSFCCFSSCCLIEASTLARGVLDSALMSESAWMMW